MPLALAIPYATAKAVTIALAGVLVVLVSIIAWRWWQFSRVTPEERERQRRAALVALVKKLNIEEKR